MSGTAYCGPTALAAATGLPMCHIEELINFHRSSSGPIEGVWPHEITKVLQTLNVSYEHCRRGGRLINFARRGGAWIVNVTRHLLFVENGRVVDTKAKDGCAVAKHPDRLRKVRRAWLIHVVTDTRDLQ